MYNKVKEVLNFWLKPKSRKSAKGTIGIFDLFGSIIIFTLIGVFIDANFNKTPIFSIIFSFFGLAGGTISIYYKYQYASLSEDKGKPWGPKN